jgi:hypothetical protein
MADLKTRIVDDYRGGFALAPVLDFDADVLREERRIGEPIIRTTLLDYTEADQLRRWYWGLVTIVADGIGVNKDDLHVRIKVKAKFVHGAVLGPTGPIYILKSIARGRIKPSALRRYVDAAVEIVFIEFLPGVRRADVLERVDEWVGPRPW